MKMKDTKKAKTEFVDEWQRTFDAISDLIFIQDKDFTIIKANKAFAEAIKTKLEDIIGKKCYELLHKRDIPWPNCPFEMSKKNGKSHTEEVDDPAIGIPLSIATSPFFDSKGEVAGSVHIAKNITELKKTMKELSDSRIQKEIIINGSPDALIVLDKKGDILFVNPAAAHIFNHTKEELIGTQFSFPMVTGEIVQINIVRKDGLAGIGEMQVVEIEWADETAYLTTIHDVTELRKMEEIKAGIDERMRMNKLKDEFISTVSHELRTPLTTMNEYVGILLDGIPGELNKDQKEYVDIIKGNIDRLARLISNLLDISKIEAGKTELKKSFIDITTFVNDVITTLQATASKKHIKINTAFKSSLLNVYADPDKIIQIFTNLISNAIKFTPDNGQISIGVTERDDAIEFSIVDTGAGISQEDMKKLFDKFQQFGRTAGSGAKGTGLGLAITKELIELHNGKIWVESKINEGSKFIFTIPKMADFQILKETIEEEIEQLLASEEHPILLTINIENLKEIKEQLDSNNFNQLVTAIKKIVTTTLRSKDNHILSASEEQLAVIFGVKIVNDARNVADRLKTALQTKLFLKKDLDAQCLLSISLATYEKNIDTAEKMIEGASKIFDKIALSIIGKIV